MPVSEGAVCVVQARMGSSRLPGKVLADLAGRPMLRFQLDRLRDLDAVELVVATSTLARDDAIVDVAEQAGAMVVRGDEHDVLDRFLAVLDQVPAETVIRLTGDCPLSDPGVIASVVARHHERGADYTSNILPRTFPKGLDVEVMSADALRTAAAEASRLFEREHVTPFLYRHPERFRLASLTTPELLGDERWTVDTPEDLSFVRELVGKMAPATHFTWQVAFAVVGARNGAGPGQLRLRPAVADDRDRLLGWRNDPVSVQCSETGREVRPDEHRAWYAAKLDDPGTRIWIGEVDGVAMGMIRLDVRAAEGRVSIALDPNHRRRGLGGQLLERTQELLAGDFQLDCLVARVAKGNVASRHLFANCHFHETDQGPDFLNFRWINRPDR